MYTLAWKVVNPPVVAREDQHRGGGPRRARQAELQDARVVSRRLPPSQRAPKLRLGWADRCPSFGRRELEPDAAGLGLGAGAESESNLHDHQQCAESRREPGRAGGTGTGPGVSRRSSKDIQGQSRRDHKCEHPQRPVDEVGEPGQLQRQQQRQGGDTKGVERGKYEEDAREGSQGPTVQPSACEQRRARYQERARPQALYARARRIHPGKSPFNGLINGDELVRPRHRRQPPELPERLQASGDELGGRHPQRETQRHVREPAHRQEQADQERKRYAPTPARAGQEQPHERPGRDPHADTADRARHLEDRGEPAHREGHQQEEQGSERGGRLGAPELRACSSPSDPAPKIPAGREEGEREEEDEHTEPLGAQQRVPHQPAPAGLVEPDGGEHERGPEEHGDFYPEDLRALAVNPGRTCAGFVQAVAAGAARG